MLGAAVVYRLPMCSAGLQSLKELLQGSVDDDLLTQLEPEEAAYALAASSGNDGFVRLDTLEDLVLEEFYLCRREAHFGV